jgi:hypothetical protein
LNIEGPKTKRVIEAARKAGYDLVRSGRISKKVLAAVAKPLAAR